MFLILILKCIAFAPFIYCFVLFWKIIRKFIAIQKLHSVSDKTFFLGHLSTLTRKADENLSLSENITINGNDFYEELRDKDVSVLWITWFPYIVLTNATSADVVLSSNKVLTKAPEYRYLEPWIGTGLLLSEPKKWKQRRKMLTPTFHFRILDDFLKVMNEHSMILVDILKEREEEVDLFKVIPLTTLDTICETAMGINVNAQRNPKSRFVNAIVFVSETIFTRLIRIAYWTDFIFYKTALGKKYQKEIDFIHEFSLDVINKRKFEIINDRYSKSETDPNVVHESIFFGSKKMKVAFIDLLIGNHLDSAQEDGTYLFTISDICEEVDTFMFEGFETTAAAICWTLHLLGNHEDIQSKAFEEIFTVFGNDTERFVTVNDLNQLKFVECCIKEALRLYPSVPLIGRKTTEDINVCGYTIPSGVSIVIYPYCFHKDPKYFPRPKEYIPERFLGEQEKSRNPYAYIPFSAGPRNCIGQRFAMYEMKTIVTNVLRNFSVRSVAPTKDIPVSIEVITRTKRPLKVSFQRRLK